MDTVETTIVIAVDISVVVVATKHQIVGIKGDLLRILKEYQNEKNIQRLNQWKVLIRLTHEGHRTSEQHWFALALNYSFQRPATTNTPSHIVCK